MGYEQGKGARLGYGQFSNHAFPDGNQRIGIYVMLSSLEMNGTRIKCSDAGPAGIGLSAADGA